MTIAVTRESFDAVLFDLDGVLTDTASLHAACWKRVFDRVLHDRAKKQGLPSRPFDIDRDYRLYVDGKPRLAGVRDFLASRDIVLPEGSTDSPAGEESIWGIAKRKDGLFGAMLSSEGVRRYAGSVRWLAELRASGFLTAVVSASHHCAEVLQAAGIDDQFDIRVDGQAADRLALAGKPEPDTFLEAARALGVPAARSVVVEDAIAGVRAGRAGDFGLVIGVARHIDPTALIEAGADVAVSDLSEMLQ